MEGDVNLVRCGKVLVCMSDILLMKRGDIYGGVSFIYE